MLSKIRSGSSLYYLLLDYVTPVCIPQPDPELTRPSSCWPTPVYLGTVDYSPHCYTDKPTVNNKLSNAVDYFLPGPNHDSDKRVSAEITQWLKRDFEDVFNEIWFFEGTNSLQLKQDSKLYQAPPRCVAYALWKPFKEELKWLQN